MDLQREIHITAGIYCRPITIGPGSPVKTDLVFFDLCPFYRKALASIVPGIHIFY